MSETAAAPSAPEQTAEKKRSRPNRLRIYLLCLFGLLILAFIQREQFARLTNGMARQCLVQGRVEDALVWLQRSKVISKTYPETEFLLGRAARHQGRMVDAQKHLLRAKFTGYPVEMIEREQCLAAAQSGQMTLAAPQLDQLLLDPRGDGEEICEAYVMGYLRLRDYAAALSLAEAWARDYPQNPRSHFWAGQAYRDLQAADLAEKSFRKALDVDPDHAASALALGEVLMEVKRVEEAAPFFQLAQVDPREFAAASVGLGRCQRALGQTDQAAATLEAVIQKHPEHLTAAVEISKLDIESARYEQAAQRLEKLIDKFPTDRELRFTYANALRGLSRTDEAQQQFARANELADKIALANDLSAQIADRPRDAELRHQIGALHLQYGVAKEGLMWLESALECNPLHAATHELLAEYYGNRSEQEPALWSLAQKHAAAARALTGANRGLTPTAHSMLPASNGAEAANVPQQKTSADSGPPDTTPEPPNDPPALSTPTNRVDKVDK